MFCLFFVIFSYWTRGSFSPYKLPWFLRVFLRMYCIPIFLYDLAYFFKKIISITCSPIPLSPRFQSFKNNVYFYSFSKNCLNLNCNLLLLLPCQLIKYFLTFLLTSFSLIFNSLMRCYTRWFFLV